MTINLSGTNESELLYPETISKRRLPINFKDKNRALFSQEMERVIPPTRLLELNDVRVSSDGILFSGCEILPESFAFPSNLEGWKRRSRLKVLLSNYLFRRLRKVEHEVLWVTDDWSTGYFHWLTDVLPRIYVVQNRLNDFELLLPWSFHGLSYVHPSLKCFGIKSIDYIKQTEVLQCRKVLMPTHTAPSGSYNEQIIRGVRDILVQSYGQAGDLAKNRRIYISRARANKRRIDNEAAVSDVLAEYQFETIYAEDLSLEQQVGICSQARYLVSNHGAGLTNMLFMPEGAYVLELRHRRDHVNNCYFTLASAINANYYYQTCHSDDSEADPHTADLVVDTATLRKTLSLLFQS